MRDQHIVVTGASRGIGAAIARSIIARGGNVTAISRGGVDPAELIPTEGGAEAPFLRDLKLDLSEVTDFDETVREIAAAHPVTGVVHAAGTQLRKPALENTVEDLRSILRVHVEVPFLLSTAIARTQVQAGIAGSHVFIGSLGSAIAIPSAAPYTIAKSAVTGMVRSLSTELAPYSIRVNSVNPGYIETALTADLLSQPAQRERILSRTPMGRFGRPEEIAGAVTYLLGPDSTYITGESLRVDGGWLSS